MDILLNYLFVGAFFTFIIDLLMGMKGIKNHILVKEQKWGMIQRILCIIIWPLSILMFSIAFIKSIFR